MINADKQLFRIQERLSVITRGFDQFSNQYGNYTFIEDAPIKICGVYFRILENYLRPLVPKKINKFKIAACTAMTIVKLQPITHKNNILLDEMTCRKENAWLGFFIGISIILDMMQPDGVAKDTGISVVDDSLQEIKKQHLKWLELKKLDDFPIFPVAAFYYVFFTMFSTRYNALLN
jgi:hypothetical protein